ncbi:MAG TPA: recombinase family protein [Sphingomicrobium sp.]|nr:recombinase family protein [Sphingomicrobium sp.]
MQAVVYTRISQDRNGDSAGVQRQEADARALAKMRGWQVTSVIVENDTSAAGKKTRPGFERLLEAVEDGSVKVVIAWALDRLTRNRKDTVRLIEACQQHGVTIALVRGSDMDMSTPSGRMVADILASVARQEIEQKSDRQKRAHRQAAEQGRRVTGARPFGYTGDGMEPREPEAQAVRDAYQWLLDGVSLGQIARRWNSAGLYTPQGAHLWSGATVGTCLRKPRNTGIRVYHDEHYDAVWSALVDRETWYAALAIMKDPNRLSVRGDQRLLTGVALCGVCEGPVHVGGNKGYPVYRCATSTGHFSRKAEPIDEYVSEVMIARLSKPDAAELFTIAPATVNKSELIREADRIRSKLDGLAALYEDGTLTAKGVRQSSERLKAQLADIDEKLAEVNGIPKAARTIVKAADVHAAWTSLGVADQREIIRALAVVYLDSPGRGSREFRPETVRIDWLSG